MTASSTGYCVLALFLGVLTASSVAAQEAIDEDASVSFRETFDRFLGRECNEHPNATQLDCARWKAEPLQFHGFMAPAARPQAALTYQEVHELPAGIFALKDYKASHALVLRARDTAASIALNIETGGARELYVRFRAFYPPIDVAKRGPQDLAVPDVLARLGFAWSATPEATDTFQEIPEAGLTFDGSGHVRENDYRVIRIDVPEAATTVALRWKVEAEPALSAMVALDDITITSKQQQVVALARVDAPDLDLRFLKASLQRALQARGIKMVTCEDDRLDFKLIQDWLDDTNIEKEQQDPERFDVLRRAVQSGCHAPPAAELFAARLVVHTDDRSGARELALTKRSLDDATATPSVATVSEPVDTHWSWNALVEAVVARIGGHFEVPSVELPEKASVGIGEPIRLDPEISAAPNSTIEWILQRCSNDDECRYLARKQRVVEACEIRRLAHSPAELSPAPLCTRPRVDGPPTLRIRTPASLTPTRSRDLEELESESSATWTIDPQIASFGVGADDAIVCSEDCRLSLSISTPGDYFLIARVDSGDEFTSTSASSGQIIHVGRSKLGLDVAFLGLTVDPLSYAMSGRIGYALEWPTASLWTTLEAHAAYVTTRDAFFGLGASLHSGGELLGFTASITPIGFITDSPFAMGSSARLGFDFYMGGQRLGGYYVEWYGDIRDFRSNHLMLLLNYDFGALFGGIAALAMRRQ